MKCVGLTLQDTGVLNLTLHGPDGLGDLFSAMKRLVYLKDLKVEAPTCEDGPIYEDHVLSVKGISFEKNVTDARADNEQQNISPSVVDDTNYYSLENDNATGEVSNRCAPTVMSFICRLKPRAGKLDLEKCVDKGVPPGLLGQLKIGCSVTLPNGTTVHSKDVHSADDPGPTFIVVDIPSAEFLRSFKEKEEQFLVHQSASACDDQIASLVIHFSPQCVIDTLVYQDFMKKFAKSTKHLVLNDTNRFSGYVSAHRIQIQLNQLNENVFPILAEYRMHTECHNHAVSHKKFKSDESIVTNGVTDGSPDVTHPQCEPAISSTYYHLRPYTGFDRSNEQTVCRDEYINESVAIPGFIDSLNELKQQLRQSYANEKISRADEYPKILFLGTGCRTPDKERNVSAILVHTTPTCSILLDCGEGTFGQIIRFYGPEKAREILRNLKAIYVSHLHSDHHLGLIGILEERRRLLQDKSPIMLLAPVRILSLLDFYDKRIDSIRNEYILVPNGDLLNQPLSDERTAELGLNYIATCLVQHCPNAFGIAFEINADEPFKITYSGDTMPCRELVRLGQNSTLLIHEATMEDELLEEAQHKRHSTVSQAIEQGAKMNAKYTMLTHFSKRLRYAKIPKLEGDISTNVGIAFDNMEVTGRDLKYLHVMFPTLKVLFTEHCDLMEKRVMKLMHKEQKRAALAGKV
ncbi:hypothetical protein HA402_002978 [Bradysia odoriphaga]|nr:hypothetical protein HA402_002978 [Bradysia odoriphaga]